MTLAVSGAPTVEAELESVPTRSRITRNGLAIFAFAALIAALLLLGRGGLVRTVYPLGAVLLGAWLYHRGPGGYIEFSWWLWHISPGIRRIADYQVGGYDPQNPMSLTPFLVSSLAIIGVLRRLPELRRARLMPWGVALAAVLYGYVMGLLRVGPMAATHALITWIVPLFFGLYCAVSWRRYPETETAIRRAFVWGSLVLAIYGIAQFINPPEWDRYWMLSSGMYSVGRAFPYEVRVFSLVNAPLPFATILVAGLFISLAGRGMWRVISLISGAIALMLSLVRSVWLAGLLGLLVYLAALPRRLLRPMLIAAMVTVTAVFTAPFLVPEKIAGPTLRIVQDRVLTFTDISHDVSYKDRASFLSSISDAVLNEPLGHGLGSTGVSSTLGGPAGESVKDFDNGIFAVLYTLGWVGGAVFLGAAMWIVMLGLPRKESITDSTAKAARAVAVTSIILAAGANVFEGVSAAVLWSFAGFIVAAQQWREHASSDEEVAG